MSTLSEVQGSSSLNLSWPQSVLYDSDQLQPTVSNPDGNEAIESTNTDSQIPVTTYNGVPRKLLRKAQTLLADEIRVLDLRRGTREDPLVGSLRKVRLSDPIVYEPLSYTWKDYDVTGTTDGDATFDTIQTIFLENADSFMNIGTNCEKALRSIRKPTAERIVWIDSICVNQDDPEERSRQVDLMPKIFARAFTVLVYLGQESTDHASSMAMSLLGQPDRLRDFDGLDLCERNSLIHLFERPYFRRTWIVQEVALAPTLELYCGPAKTYISAFAEKPLQAILESRIAHPPWLKHSKYTDVSLRQAPTTGMSQADQVLNLIFDTVSCSCKDDRDRVFALLGLLHFGSQDGLRADYNLSTAQVYTGIAAFLATNGLAWAVFMLASHSNPNGCSNLPSWVPNWTVLGKAGPEDLELLHHTITQCHNFRPGATIRVSGVARSGAITVRGKALGTVTPSKYDECYMAVERDRMRKVHHVIIGSMNSNWERAGVSSQLFSSQFLWTLAKPPQSPFDDSWECHIEFGLQSKLPSDAKYLAVMLQDKATVLILRQDDDVRDQYTLVEIGKPLVWGVVPREWAWDESEFERCINMSLLRLSISTLEDRRLHDIPLPAERFPRLRQYPHLWGYNPATSSVTLKHKAIERILSTDLTTVNLWLEWQKQAVIGVQILSNKTRLHQLIDEVHDLEQEDYKHVEAQAGLEPNWSLGHFLGLFVKDPLATGPMSWPSTQVDGDQTNGESAALPFLMRWAAATYRFLVQLRRNSNIPWLISHPPPMKDAYPDAMVVARSQQFTAPGVTNGRETRDSERAAFLLQKILNQSSESTLSVPEQGRRIPALTARYYWDWKSFESTVEERLRILRDVQPDIESLRSCFRTPTPDLSHADAHQLLAAHGVDLGKNEYAEIRIR